MRKLAIFSFAFAAAAAVYVYLLPPKVCLIAAGVCLLCGLALCFFRLPQAKRVRIALFGLTAGLLWSFGYEQFRIAPLREYCGDKEEITVTVCDFPEVTKYGCCIVVRLDGGRMLLYLNGEQTLRPGDTLRLTAKVADVSRGSGEEENLYYSSKDIRLLGFQRSEPEITTAEKIPLRDYPTVAAKAVRERITALFSADTEGFLRALLTGDRSGLTYETKNQMSLVGISHVVAVSGLHVSLIAGAVLLLCFRRRRLAAVVGIPVMLFFAAMLGFPASVVRAVVMHAVLLLAPLFRRENDAPTSLGFALLLLLVENPWAIANVGLQLSFGATAGILLFTEPLLRWMERRFLPGAFRKKHPRLSGLARGLFSIQAMSLGATVLTLPLVAAYFGTVSLIALVTNLLLLTLIGYLFTFGCAAVLLSFLWRPLGAALAWVLDWGVRLVLRVIGALSRIPFAAVYTQSDYICLWIAGFYVLLAIFLFGRCRCKRVFCAAVAATLACGVAFSMLPGDAALTFTALNVGQGQCLLLQPGGLTVVVDCGGSYADDAGEQLARRLLMQGKTQIDFLVLTHFDEDHVGGVPQLLSRMEVGTILAPDQTDDGGNRERILTAAEEACVAVRFVRQDVTVEFPTGRLEIFAPVRESGDNDGISALMSVEEYDILITGDMDARSEQLLAVRHGLHDIEVLVAGHHGSRYSTGSALLQTVTPEIVVISVGENSYGHPAPETLARIEASGALVLRTDAAGTIVIER